MADLGSAVLSRLDTLPDDAVAPSRAAAAARLTAMGLPRPRDEYWRYTPPSLFNADEPAETPVAEGDSPLFDDIEAVRLIFVDGHFDAAASDSSLPAGLEITSLATMTGDHWGAAFYGTREAAGQAPVARPFAALNSAMATDGLAIRVTAPLPQPLHIIYRRAAPGADVVLHHLVRVEPGAEATILESGDVGARGNLMIEADIADTARLHLLSSARARADRLGLNHIFARVGAKALFKAFTLSVGGRLMRHEAVIEIVGDDAIAHIAGAVLGDGRDGSFHHDDTVFVTHAAERGESRQVFKKVLKNGAVGVFQGKILVKPGAQKTDGYQISQALLLDEASQFLAKPELEIYADDVRCSHGSTTGAIDPDTLYYLRSRGVPRDRAVVLLVLSFLADALAEIDNESLRERIAARLDDWLVAHQEG